MPVKFDPQEFDVALRDLRHVAPSAPSLPAAELPVTAEDWQRSEMFKIRLITARTKLKLMRDRSDALRDSLQRFQAQQRSVTRA